MQQIDGGDGLEIGSTVIEKMRLETCLPFIKENLSHARRRTITVKELVQACYALAWVGDEPTTLEPQGTILFTEPLQSVGRLNEICCDTTKWLTSFPIKM